MRRDISPFLIKTPKPMVPSPTEGDAGRLAVLRALIDEGDASGEATDFDIDAEIAALEAKLSTL